MSEEETKTPRIGTGEDTHEWDGDLASIPATECASRDYRLLVVDADPASTQQLTSLLRGEGYVVTEQDTPTSVLYSLTVQGYDLILLDVLLPEMDGFELCRRIRLTTTRPIIFISERDDLAAKLMGLQAGADDYVCKPYDPDELLARIGATLRRSRRLPDSQSELEAADLILDPGGNTVMLVQRGKTVSLTPIEARLLRFLLKHAGRSLHRDTLSIAAWGDEYEREQQALDMHIQRLRSKIEENPAQPRLVLKTGDVRYKYQPGTTHRTDAA